MTDTTSKGWNPYLAGSLTGVLIILSVWITGNFFGASTTFSRVYGMILGFLMPSHASWVQYNEIIKPVIDWQWMFVIGILLGAFASSISSSSFKTTAIPSLWAERFGPGSAKMRASVAFLGGFLMLFGARFAGGCTSGHGLSGSIQLAVSGLLTFSFMFIGGIITAKLVYKGGRNK